MNTKILMEHRSQFPELLNKEGLLGYGAEIGVLQGTYGGHLLANWKGKKLYLVDSWRDLPNYLFTPDITYDFNFALQMYNDTFNQVYQYNERATIIRELSKEATILFNDNFFDFVYIDTNHSYESCKEDIALWYPKVRKGGYLCGHDYLNFLYDQLVNTYLKSKVKEKYEDSHIPNVGVKKAVDEFVKENNLILYTDNPDNSFSGTEQDIIRVNNGEILDVKSWFIKKPQ